jgi:hypothetical protein
MKTLDFETIVTALNREQVRYLIVGGLAAVAHGVGRMTFDVDVVIRLDPPNIHAFFRAMAASDFRPRVPVTAAQFADADLRQSWIRDKGMLVLRFWSDTHRQTDVDLFVREPFDFDETEAKALVETLPQGTPFRFVDAATLIAMKREAGRAKDLEDIRMLESLQGE